MNVPPLQLHLEVTGGAHISACFDHAADIALHLHVSVIFVHNGVRCLVWPRDAMDRSASREIFVRNYYAAHKDGAERFCSSTPHCSF